MWSGLRQEDTRDMIAPLALKPACVHAGIRGIHQETLKAAHGPLRSGFLKPLPTWPPCLKDNVPESCFLVFSSEAIDCFFPQQSDPTEGLRWGSSLWGLPNLESRGFGPLDTPQHCHVQTQVEGADGHCAPTAHREEALSAMACGLPQPWVRP